MFRDKIHHSLPSSHSAALAEQPPVPDAAPASGAITLGAPILASHRHAEAVSCSAKWTQHLLV